MVYAFLIISNKLALEVSIKSKRSHFSFVDLFTMNRTELPKSSAAILLRRTPFICDVASSVMRKPHYSEIRTPTRSIVIDSRHERLETQLKYMAIQLANYLGGNKDAFT